MRFISTRTHAVNDYIFGILLIAIPLFYANRGGAAVWIPISIGVVLILQSLITNYEFSLANILPMKLHLVIDALAGILLIISPWLFGFAESVWRPHVIVGVVELGLAIMTNTHREQSVDRPTRPGRSVTTPVR